MRALVGRILVWKLYSNHQFHSVGLGGSKPQTSREGASRQQTDLKLRQGHLASNLQGAGSHKPARGQRRKLPVTGFEGLNGRCL